MRCLRGTQTDILEKEVRKVSLRKVVFELGKGKNVIIIGISQRKDLGWDLHGLSPVQTTRGGRSIT